MALRTRLTCTLYAQKTFIVFWFCAKTTKSKYVERTNTLMDTPLLYELLHHTKKKFQQKQTVILGVFLCHEKNPVVVSTLSVQLLFRLGRSGCVGHIIISFHEIAKSNKYYSHKRKVLFKFPSNWFVFNSIGWGCKVCVRSAICC